MVRAEHLHAPRRRDRRDVAQQHRHPVHQTARLAPGQPHAHPVALFGASHRALRCLPKLLDHCRGKREQAPDPERRARAALPPRRPRRRRRVATITHGSSRDRWPVGAPGWASEHQATGALHGCQAALAVTRERLRGQHPAALAPCARQRVQNAVERKRARPRRQPHAQAAPLEPDAPIAPGDVSAARLQDCAVRAGSN